MAPLKTKAIQSQSKNNVVLGLYLSDFPQYHYLIEINKNMSFTDIFAWTKMSNSLKAKNSISI